MMTMLSRSNFWWIPTIRMSTWLISPISVEHWFPLISMTSILRRSWSPSLKRSSICCLCGRTSKFWWVSSGPLKNSEIMNQKVSSRMCSTLLNWTLQLPNWALSSNPILNKFQGVKLWSWRPIKPQCWVLSPFSCRSTWLTNGSVPKSSPSSALNNSIKTLCTFHTIKSTQTRLFMRKTTISA